MYLIVLLIFLSYVQPQGDGGDDDDDDDDDDEEEEEEEDDGFGDE